MCSEVVVVFTEPLVTSHRNESRLHNVDVLKTCPIIVEGKNNKVV